MIPIKDAAILSRMEHAELRRVWRQRIIDHDGDRADEGGIPAWIALTDGLGLERELCRVLAGVLPATRFAVDAYLHFVRDQQPARGDRLVPDGNVRAEHDPRTCRQHAGAL